MESELNALDILCIFSGDIYVCLPRCVFGMKVKINTQWNMSAPELSHIKTNLNMQQYYYFAIEKMQIWSGRYAADMIIIPLHPAFVRTEKKKTDRLRQAIHFLDQHLFVCSFVGKVLVCTYIFHVFPLYISNKWVIYMGPPSGRRHLYTDQFHHIHTNRQINTSTHKCDARPSSMNDVRANIPSHRTPQFSHGNLYDILS